MDAIHEKHLAGNHKNYVGEIKVSTALNKQKQLIIRIRDNGIGIEKKVLKTIFDPFFTTKEAGKGTGLGLSISFEIIQSHEGQIQVNSKVGTGSEFIISLPYNQPEFKT